MSNAVPGRPGAAPPCPTSLRRRIRPCPGAWRFPWTIAVVLAVGALLLGLPAAGPAQVFAQAQGEDVIALTLAEAVDLALAYDLEHAMARLRWENARIDSRIAQASGPVSPYDRLLQELEERRAENEYVSARRELVIGVIRDYLDLKQAQRQVDIARRELELGREELAIVREMVRIGERHSLEERREENRVAGLELALDTAQRDVENRRRALLLRLGLPEDARLELVDEPEQAPWPRDLAETLAYAEEHAFAAWERQANLRIAAMDLEALRVQNPAPLQLEKAENEYRIAEMNALQAARTFHNTVRTAYHTLSDAARRLETAVVDYELAVADHDVARRRYEAGLTTDLDWARAELALRSAEQSYHEAIYSYVLARLELLNVIGHPLDLGEEPAP
ncbi:MAG TPA: TolC family protein [Limnochordales bacterium]|nr:TolC family protein [Limnochordales bacterium]